MNMGLFKFFPEYFPIPLNLSNTFFDDLLCFCNSFSHSLIVGYQVVFLLLLLFFPIVKTKRYSLANPPILLLQGCYFQEAVSLRCWLNFSIHITFQSVRNATVFKNQGKKRLKSGGSARQRAKVMEQKVVPAGCCTIPTSVVNSQSIDDCLFLHLRFTSYRFAILFFQF